MTAPVPANQSAEAVEAAGDEVQLLIPADDIAEPMLSIVIPALNEELTVGDFVAWCREGLAGAGVAGEVLIIDSSTDRTPEIALASGARVLRVPKRGLGRAYKDALPYIRGRYILMGDADCTYDFRQLAVFVEKLQEGYEFVMGSRFKGSIEEGSMPRLHQHFGTPLTTWILNVLYSSHFSDIHCGMRAITRDAFVRMQLRSESWEYASEMVLKSVHMKLPTAEVPVRFLKDREGRVSHHKRSGWLSPWKAAWINLRAMFVYGADFFVFKPGIVLLVLGLVIALPLTFGSIAIGAFHASLITQFVGLTLSVVGLQSFFLGCYGQILHDYSGEATRKWLRHFSYTRTVLVAGGVFVAGLLMSMVLVDAFLRSGLRLPPIGLPEHIAVTGFMFMILGFMTFTFTLLLHAAALAGGKRID
jgi:glycosyltransferase involved in cell wall biosynthesis